MLLLPEMNQGQDYCQWSQEERNVTEHNLSLSLKVGTETPSLYQKGFYIQNSSETDLRV